MHAWKTCQPSSNELIFNASGELVHLTARSTHSMDHALFSIHETLEYYYMEYSAERKNGREEKKVFVFLSSLHKSDGIMGNADYLVLLANPMPLHTYLASSYAYSSSVSS